MASIHFGHRGSTGSNRSIKWPQLCCQATSGSRGPKRSSLIWLTYLCQLTLIHCSRHSRPHTKSLGPARAPAQSKLLCPAAGICGCKCLAQPIVRCKQELTVAHTEQIEVTWRTAFLVVHTSGIRFEFQLRFAQWHRPAGPLCFHAVCFPRAEEGALRFAACCTRLAHVPSSNFQIL